MNSIFLTFSSQEERREYGGSSFIEFQFCRMPVNSKTSSIVTIDNIKHWQLDSLYVNDYEKFSDIYGHIFDCGIYSNMGSGLIDIFGINYYRPETINSIISKIYDTKLTDYQTLIKWLELAKKYNGFYILGV